MNRNSFNLTATNLMIGLISGHRNLAPLSYLIAKTLRYQLHSVEQSFISNNETVHPELIAYSGLSGTTILAEFTAAIEPDDRKKRQLKRYLDVCTEDLVSMAYVPAVGARANGTWLLIYPDSAAEFEQMCAGTPFGAESLNRLLVQKFGRDHDGSFKLTHLLGKLPDEELTEALCRTMQFEKIPMGYVRVLMEDCSHKTLVAPLIQALIARVAKGEYEFFVPQLCNDIFPLWKRLPPARQASIADQVDSLLRLLRQKNLRGRTKQGHTWLRKESSSPAKWKIISPDNVDPSLFFKSIRTITKKFALEVQTETRQLNLPEDASIP